jgi:hypothetical protein
MIEDATQSSHSDDGVRVSERGEDLVWWATWVGLSFAIVGLVDGLSMALKKRLATCPDGTYFPDDATDINCYVHPQGGLGIAIAALSVVLGILLVLSSIAARASLKGRPRSR